MTFLHCMTSSSRSHWDGGRILPDSKATRIARGRPKLFAAGVGLLGTLAFNLPAVAATATATMTVTATVDATCLITATPLAFGAYAGTQTDELMSEVVYGGVERNRREAVAIAGECCFPR
ncbi:spore coat protein U domain-containing protein [Burkholderia ambifaria]|uniref:spore coat protein U domain-containing protein n=1 Tax=Burkholderia ambifaria TaxID=152480 RepID=UPI00158C9612|nr:spore coat protein U domain-containing protein [Burkholderia ambifaria]